MTEYVFYAIPESDVAFIGWRVASVATVIWFMEKGVDGWKRYTNQTDQGYWTGWLAPCNEVLSNG
jgi:hypothetical protein